MLDADPAAPTRPAGRLTAALAALVCLGLAGFAAVRIHAELTRSPSAAEWQAASAAELAARWHSRPAGTIFPEALGYGADLGGRETATRVGIAPGADCASAFDTRLAALMKPFECRGAVRATYLDQTQGLVITVAVVAVPGADKAIKAMPGEGAPSPGLRALAPPGSVAARFTDRARQASSFRHRGPYLAITSTGYTDGRPAKAKQKQTDLYTIAPQLAEEILTRLAGPLTPSCQAVEFAC